MRIGILGTRGIPNAYGGFEQFAQYLSCSLIAKGHEVIVYNSSLHPYKQSEWNGVPIVHCKDWEDRLGSAGQFIYDLNCINDARRRNYDVLLHLGYTSDSVWHWRWPRKTVHVVNMDGLEWMRSKYGKFTRKFLKWAESLAARNAGVLIADSPATRERLLDKYGKKAEYIPYGATIFEDPDPSYLCRFNLQPGSYFLLIARMEPENNIEMIINGYLESGQQKPLVIVGSTVNAHGSYLCTKYQHERIRFTGSIYEPAIINNLRYHSSLYFHGHSVGGTNPSLLEAMACRCRIAAHDNIFNRAVLQKEALFFSDEQDIADLLNTTFNLEEMKAWQESNLRKIKLIYDWDKIINRYEEVMLAAATSRL